MGNKSGYTSFKTKLSLWSTHYRTGSMRYNHPVTFSVWRKLKCNRDIILNNYGGDFFPQINDNPTISTMAALTVISTAVFFPYLGSASAPHRRSAPRSQWGLRHPPSHEDRLKVSENDEPPFQFIGILSNRFIIYVLL